jgi:GLPGLI family protein
MELLKNAGRNKIIMKAISFLFILLFSVITASSQALFITKGKIEFERKTNTHRLYFTDGDDDGFSETFKKLIPQFKTDYFELIFSGGKSVYRPGKENDEPKNGFFESPAGTNVVYKDLDQMIMSSQKQVFESQFLLSDSVKKPKWKLLPETRTIAGYECRKAITTICDSVVVVAFYTDEIIPANGPESFGNLPGMILGLAVPRLYTTWFATKV